MKQIIHRKKQHRIKWNETNSNFIAPFDGYDIVNDEINVVT